MLIFPAIDVRGGKCVRLAQGDYNREKIYGDDPLALAKQFEDEGATWLHVVDLDGAKTGIPENLAALKRIAAGTTLNIEFGGGIRSLETAHLALDHGASRVVMGTKLVQDPDLAKRFFERFDEKAVAGIDARDGKVAVAGWVEESDRDAEEVAAWVARMGGKRIVLTDISRDGMLTGPNLELLSRVQKKAPIKVIQSGGIGSLNDIQSLLELDGVRPEGVIIGRAIYEAKFTVREAVKLASGA